MLTTSIMPSRRARPRACGAIMAMQRQHRDVGRSECASVPDGSVSPKSVRGGVSLREVLANAGIWLGEPGPERLAYHEAGHVVMRALLRLRTDWVTICSLRTDRRR